MIVWTSNRLRRLTEKIKSTEFDEDPSDSLTSIDVVVSFDEDLSDSVTGIDVVVGFDEII